MVGFSDKCGRVSKRREALGNVTSAFSKCVNVNRTSLDHLLLGENADVDKMSIDPSIKRDRRDVRRSLWV
jgi:hypothetical protein